MTIKLNIGAGATKLEGWTPIDRKIGLEAYPLAYDDNSVDEIRASHILEHFSFAQAIEAVQEWHRVLKPGGRMRIAVPGFDSIVELSHHDRAWPFYLMGGQTDENDFHRSVWNASSLSTLLRQVGLANVQPWQSENTDCASLPCSLNLEAIKPLPKPKDVKICAVMSIPRVGWNDAWGQVLEALAPLRIPVRRFSGAFWGQCMQRAFNDCIKDGVDWILTIDYDSMFTAEHVDELLGMLGTHPEIDALAALQQRRGSGYPLVTKAELEKKKVDCPVCKQQYECQVCSIDNNPMRVTTAHFGLTLIRVEDLLEVPKPWFYGQPDSSCEWDMGGDKLDDDIWFWHQWRLAGKTLYIDPNCRIGHLELLVAELGPDMQPRHVYVPEWREANGLQKKEEKKNDDSIDTPVAKPCTGGSDGSFSQLSGEFDSTRRVRPSFRDDGKGTIVEVCTDSNGVGNAVESNAEAAGTPA